MSRESLLSASSFFHLLFSFRDRVVGSFGVCRHFCDIFGHLLLYMEGQSFGLNPSCCITESWFSISTTALSRDLHNGRGFSHTQLGGCPRIRPGRDPTFPHRFPLKEWMTIPNGKQLPQQCPFTLFWGGGFPGSPTKMDYRRKGTLIAASLLEDLDSGGEI